MASAEGDADMEVIALFGVAAVKRERSDRGAAKAVLGTARDFVQRHFAPEHPAQTSPLFETGLLYLASRSFVEAKTALAEVIARYAHGKTPVPNQVLALTALAQTELGLGNNELAATHVAEASAIASIFALAGEPSYWVAYCLLVRGEVDKALGRAASARELAAKSLLQLTRTVEADHPVTQ